MQADAAAYGLPACLTAALETAGVTRFFPIQRDVVPLLLRADARRDAAVGDIAVTAPTGSGKTLMYALPTTAAVLAAAAAAPTLPRLRVLVLVPTRELAAQVAEVYTTLLAGAPAPAPFVATAAGLTTFHDEQAVLSLAGGAEARAAGVAGASALAAARVPSILVATPGRLTDHLAVTRGFTLAHLTHLVCDEADRLLSEAYSDWPHKVRSAMFTAGPVRERAYMAAAAAAAGVPSCASAGDDTADVAAVVPGRQRAWRHSDGAVGYVATPDPAAWPAARAVSSGRTPATCSGALCLDALPWAAGAAAAGAPSEEVRVTPAPAPLRRIVCSATLTRNPRKLAALHLVAPRYFVASADVLPSVARAATLGAVRDAGGTEADDGEVPTAATVPAAGVGAGEVGGDGARLYAVPASLVQAWGVCGASEKPVALLHLLRVLEGQPIGGDASAAAAPAGLRAIVFAGSVQTTHRLTRLLQLYGGLRGRVVELSSGLSQPQRDAVLAAVRAGGVSVLVTSDVAARGLDLPALPAVIHYDAAPRVKTYVHRVGRCARAGRLGATYTLVRPEQARHFKTHVLGRLQPGGAPAPAKETVTSALVAPYMPRLAAVLPALRDALDAEARGALSQFAPVPPFEGVAGDGDEDGGVVVPPVPLLPSAALPTAPAVGAAAAAAAAAAEAAAAISLLEDGGGGDDDVTGDADGEKPAKPAKAAKAHKEKKAKHAA